MTDGFNNMNYNRTYLHIHVAVHRHQVALVLHPPLQLHHHRLSCETVQKGLGVQWQTLQKRVQC